MRTQKETKNLVLLFGILAVCFIVIAIGALTEKDEVDEPVTVIEETIEKEKTEQDELKTQEDTPENIDSKPVILTLETSKEFSEVMGTKGNPNGLYSKFAESQKRQIIQFKAHIDLVENHDNYKTRYDILLSGGAWVDQDTVSPGPQFKFEDVNCTDLGIKDLYLPDWVRVSSNVKVTAKIVQYDTNAGVMILDPIELEKE